VAAAIFYSAGFKSAGAPGPFIQLSFLGSLTTGLITITVAFFVFEFIMQRLHAPHFFPDGGLYSTPNTLKIKIKTRLIAFLFACNLIPFFSIFHVFKRMNSTSLDPAQIVEQLYSAIIIYSIVFMAVAVWLTYLVNSNLTRPFKEIIQVLRAIQKGSFDRKVRVTSNDEIGYTGDVINEDYFDFLDVGGSGEKGVSVVVGDVSDHGIPSALLMATARASLRQRSTMPGGIGRIVSDVNRQLTLDVEESGQFMTLFYLNIDLDQRCLQWVRAGHDPAIFYDPETDTFEDLRGSGVALGLDENWNYAENEKTGLETGQIVLLCTDGLWEAHNPKGEMFVKKRIFDIVRQHAAAGAKDISNRLFEALVDFQGDNKADDDVTLVVVKIA
ncbi:MAG: SpoIIE family protein phosphatase, partial [Deltaproteobacteria bacterium]|nr:SpoIIE family protein phosphatase [Deltaproteobacteria bacterium]